MRWPQEGRVERGSRAHARDLRSRKACARIMASTAASRIAPPDDSILDRFGRTALSALPAYISGRQVLCIRSCRFVRRGSSVGGRCPGEGDLDDKAALRTRVDLEGCAMSLGDR